MERTPQEIFEHHMRAVGAGDLDALLDDYTEDAMVITPQGTARGRPAIREAFTGMLGQIPDATFDMYTQIYADDVLLAEWSAVGSKARITDGVDTFVFRDGLIRVQTVRFTLEPVG
jgi:SnoaL-like domain